MPSAKRNRYGKWVGARVPVGLESVGGTGMPCGAGLVDLAWQMCRMLFNGPYGLCF